MKKLIERALYIIGDIVDRQNFLPNIQSKSNSPFSIDELLLTVPQRPNNFYILYNPKEDIIEKISPNIFETFNRKPSDSHGREFLYNIFSPDYLDIFNKINDSCFWFAAHHATRSTVYKYYFSFVVNYQLPNGEIKHYLNNTYPISTNSLGQVTNLFMVQTDISHFDFINNQAISFNSIDPELPSYSTTNFWGKYEKTVNNQLNLDARDITILKQFREGSSIKDTADRLNLSEATIKDYRKKMIRKTQHATMHELLANYVLQENNSNNFYE